MTTSSGTGPVRTESRVVSGGASDVTESLSVLGDAAESLRRMGDKTEEPSVADLLATICIRTAQIGERVEHLAPLTTLPIADVAGDLSDAVETLVSRWDGLVPFRRNALIDIVLARRSELLPLLARVAQAAIADEAIAARPAVIAVTPTHRAKATKGTAAQAWEEWTLQPTSAGADVFLRLSESWIEGTGAQLARNERSRSSMWSNATEVMDRLRHHLVLLAEAGSVSYTDALATARSRVVDELHGSAKGAPSPRKRLVRG